MKLVRVIYTGALTGLVAATLIGCNNAKLQELADKAKDAASKGAETVKKQVSSTTADVQETLQLAGDIKLTLDTPVETKACYARFIAQGSQRPTVFELRSYNSPDQESAPSVFFHAQVRAASPAELSGQIVSGRLFVQATIDGPTWYSDTGSPAEVKITSVDDKTLTAEIVNATVRNTRSDAAIDATGTFNAVHQ